MNDVEASLREVVQRCFFATHHGYSTDDVVIDDALNADFISACLRELPTATPFELNWKLYNLRKGGQRGIGKVTTAKRRANHDAYVHAAEIAARSMEDKGSGRNIDRILCDPATRHEFDSIAQGISPDVSTYLLRKAALSLRKARRLKPELLKRVADWGKTVLTFPADPLRQNPNLIPRQPGAYLFRDSTGYLYIGEAGNLRVRVAQHLDHSDRKALARYFWQNG